MRRIMSVTLLAAFFILIGGPAMIQAQDSLKTSPVTEMRTQSEVVPKISVPANTFTFESVPDGSEIEHDFIVKNLGDAPLVIKSVKTG